MGVTVRWGCDRCAAGWLDKRRRTPNLSPKRSKERGGGEPGEGRWECLEGKGCIWSGMDTCTGSQWETEQGSDLNRKVALKFLDALIASGSG